MMVIGTLLALSSGLGSTADHQRKAQIPCGGRVEKAWDEDTTDRLVRNPPHLSSAHLPAGSKIGRCLFEVNGKRLINGKCAYEISKNGDIEIDGPRQVYAGLDYPECWSGAMDLSTDYFVYVDWNDGKELNDGSPGPGWEATWNEDKRNTHAQASLGSVKRHGACYSNAQTKICLWKK